MKSAMKALLFLIPLLGFFSCTTSNPEAPAPVAQELSPRWEEPSVGPVRTRPAATEAAAFDPRSVSAQEFNAARDEIRRLIVELNRVIRARDYEAWLSYLSDDFIAAINSPAYLRQLTESSRQLLGHNIVLETPQDYFTHVVVAARENIRLNAHLDDIEFLSHTRVKAFAIRGTQRLRLFEFVKVGNVWKVAFSG
jgi:hypothetical protein